MKNPITTGANIMESTADLSSLSLAHRERTPLENFGEMVRFLRQKKSLRVSEIAHRTGLSAQTIVAIEAGKAGLAEIVPVLPDLSRSLHLPAQLLTEALLTFGLDE